MSNIKKPVLYVTKISLGMKNIFAQKINVIIIAIILKNLKVFLGIVIANPPLVSSVY